MRQRPVRRPSLFEKGGAAGPGQTPRMMPGRPWAPCLPWRGGRGGSALLARQRRQQGTPDVSLGRLPGSAPGHHHPRIARVSVPLYPGGAPVQGVVKLPGGAERGGVQPARISDGVIQTVSRAIWASCSGPYTRHAASWCLVAELRRALSRPFSRCSLAMVCSLVSGTPGA